MCSIHVWDSSNFAYINYLIPLITLILVCSFNFNKAVIYTVSSWQYIIFTICNYSYLADMCVGIYLKYDPLIRMVRMSRDFGETGSLVFSFLVKHDQLSYLQNWQWSSALERIFRMNQGYKSERVKIYHSHGMYFENFIGCIYKSRSLVLFSQGNSKYAFTKPNDWKL